MIAACHLLHRPAPPSSLRSLLDVSPVAPPLFWPSPAPRARMRRPGGPPCCRQPGMFRWICMCVCVCDWGRGVDRLNFHLYCLLQRAGAAASGLPHRRRGVAPAPRFQLYVRCAGPCHASGGCRAPFYALVPRWHRVRCDVRVVCWLDACTAAWLGDCRLWLA